MEDEIRKIEKLVNPIASWDSVTNKEGRCLYNLARQVQQGCIVEIGSWKGRSTIWLAKGSQAGSRMPVYAIDPHKGTGTHTQYGIPSTFDEFKTNIARAGVEHIVKPIVSTSGEAAAEWNLPVELLFIDGDHKYMAVKKDLEMWSKFLINGAMVVLHDTTGYVGPRRVVRENFFGSGNYRYIGVAGKITHAVYSARETSLPDFSMPRPAWELYVFTYNAAAMTLVHLLRRRPK